MDKVTILGVKVSRLKFDQTMEIILNAIKMNSKKFIVTANPEIILHAHENKDYLKILERADIITPDGIGVVKGAGILGERISERVTGFDLFMDLLEKSNDLHAKIYLLGSKENVLLKVVGRMKKEYPGIDVVGMHNGFFNTEEESDIIDEIKGKKPDLIFVALGFPRQEKWIGKHLDKFDRGVFMGIGGSFDVFAGEAKRAPLFWRKLNIEWLYRLINQPSRWRRMLALPRFAAMVIKQRLTKRG